MEIFSAEFFHINNFVRKTKFQISVSQTKPDEQPQHKAIFTVVVVFEFCCYQNGNRGEHGADVLRRVETEQEEEQDHAPMDRVALA